ncbi:MAG: glycosyltransferase [Streptosporangiaceae bacterium]|nr:glycosyltransferase [Streptosporangiaceae bacterium]
MAALGALRVIRVCSVFEPATLTPAAARYDAIGGMQNHAAELSRCLDQMGIRQVVLTSRLDGPAGRTRFGEHGQVVRTGVHIPVARQAWAAAAARTALSERRPVSLVHAHCGEDVALMPLAALAARRHGCPLVVTVHTSIRHTLRVDSARKALLRLAGGLGEGRALRRADAVIALTRQAADLLVRDGLPDSKVRVIPPGYDPHLFSTVIPDPFPELPRPRVGYIGRIAPQKDVGTLVKAFGMVAEPACLLIVGDGPGRPAAERLAAGSVPAGGRVHFTGFLPHAVIPAVLQHIDLLVLATKYEELPSVLVEGMAAGLPVVASRVGGIPALVDHDVNGLLVPPADPATLAAAITRVLAEPGTAARLSAAARRTAERYTWPALARQVAALYRELTAPDALPGLPGAAARRRYSARTAATAASAPGSECPRPAAALPSLAASAGSVSTARTAVARASGRPGGTSSAASSPVSAGTPPTRVATTGTPARSASCRMSGCPSQMLGSTKTSAAASSAGRSGRCPANWTVTPSEAA